MPYLKNKNIQPLNLPAGQQAPTLGVYPYDSFHSARPIRFEGKDKHKKIIDNYIPEVINIYPEIQSWMIDRSKIKYVENPLFEKELSDSLREILNEVRGKDSIGAVLVESSDKNSFLTKHATLNWSEAALKDTRKKVAESVQKGEKLFSQPAALAFSVGKTGKKVLFLITQNANVLNFLINDSRLNITL